MYSISKERFLDTPLITHTFRFGHLVNRENFTSFSILSFRLSKGSPWAQRVVWHFAKEQTGFDFQTTYENYLNAGGYKTLSNSETDMILRAYISAGHSRAYKQPLDVLNIDPGFKIRTSIDFDGQISLVLFRTTLTPEELEALRGGQLEQMMYLSKRRIAAMLRTRP